MKRFATSNGASVSNNKTGKVAGKAKQVAGDANASGGTAVTERTEAQAQAWVAERTAKLSEALQAAVKAGDVLASIGTVKIGKDASPTKQEASRDYLKLDAMNARGMAAIHDGRIQPAKPKPETGKDERTPNEKLAGACDFHNYGYDLDVRAKVRADLLTSLEGPEKAIAKTVVALRGLDYDDDAIRENIKTAPKFKGMANLDAIIDAALASK